MCTGHHAHTMHPPEKHRKRVDPHTPAQRNSTVLLLSVIASLFVTVDSTQCGGELSASYGVVQSAGYPQSYPADGVICLWHIAATTDARNSSTADPGLTLYFRRFLTQESSSEDNDVETLQVFTTNPDDGNSSAYVQFSGKRAPLQPRSIPSDEVWLRFQSSRIRTTSSSSPESEPLGFRIIYIAHGADVQCNGNPIQNGGIKDNNGTFPLDTRVEFQCDRGYRLTGATHGTCILDGEETDTVVSPQWDHLPKCVTTCPGPGPMPNRTYVQSDPAFNLNSTITFSCDAPYRLTGQKVLTCVLDSKGSPQWNGGSPTCTIPDCSRSISFTEPSGAFVNPSYPRQSVNGGKTCTWDIQVEQGKIISFRVSYLDLPQDGQLTFSQGPSVIKRLESTSLLQSFNSTSASVSVTYNSAAGNSNNHRGFFITYSTVDPSGLPPPVASSTSTFSSTATPVGTSTSEHDGQTAGSGADDGSAGAIAAGVTVPVILILVIVGVVYWCYRKKYPVRMIMGRDFGKFSNPEYRAPPSSSLHTLVREDAEEFFQQTQPSGPVNVIIGEDGEEPRVSYVNEAFQYDTQDADEEEVEKRFRERKSYLFKTDKGDKVDGDSDDDEKRAPPRKKIRSKENGEARQDQGHDNAAYSDDSDTDINAKDRAQSEEEIQDKDTSDSTSKASVVSSSSDDKDKSGTSPEDEKTIEKGSGSSADQHSGREYHSGMTVREFLHLSKEQRSNSDVVRIRAGSLTSYDVKKSARNRAQSAESIWTRASPSSPESPKEELKHNKNSAISSTAARSDLQTSAQNLHGTFENLTELAVEGGSTDDVHRVGPPDEDQAQMAEEIESPQSGKPGEEVNQHAHMNEQKDELDGRPPESERKEKGGDNESVRKDSSSSASSCENISSTPKDKPGTEASSASNSDSSLDGDPVASTYHLDSTSLSDSNDYVNVSELQSPIAAGVLDGPRQDDSASADEAGDLSDLTPVNVTEKEESNEDPASIVIVSLSDADIVENQPSTGAIEQTPQHNQFLSSVDHSNASRFAAVGGLPSAQQSPESDEAKSVSLSSSLEVQNSKDMEDIVVIDKDSDASSITSDRAPADDAVSFEEIESDSPSFEIIQRQGDDFEEERVLRLGASDKQPPNHSKKPISVQVLPSMTYSDASSKSCSSSSDDDSDEDDNASAAKSSLLRPLKFLLTPPVNPNVAGGGDETPAQQLPLSTDPDVQMSRTPPSASGPPDLAVLRLQPSEGGRRPSESDSDDGGFTTEDINAVLAEDSEDSSDNGLQLGLPSHQQLLARAPLKVDPSQTFVFSEEDNEDFDV